MVLKTSTKNVCVCATYMSLSWGLLTGNTSLLSAALEAVQMAKFLFVFFLYQEKDAQNLNHHFILRQSQWCQPLLFPCHPPFIQGSTGLFHV